MKPVSSEPTRVVISGSFRRHYGNIVAAIEEFERIGCIVLSPAKSTIVNSGDDFAVLESDLGRSRSEIELKHLNAISQASVLYVVNPEGYIGISTSLEIGWALRCKIPVVMKHKPADSILEDFSQSCLSPTDAASLVADRSATALSEQASVREAQKYISRVVKERGFEDESARDVLLLLVEEVGELARAIRKTSGLKIDVSSQASSDVADELADVFIYLLDLANICQTDLMKALIRKEAKNAKRVWEVIHHQKIKK